MSKTTARIMDATVPTAPGTDEGTLLADRGSVAVGGRSTHDRVMRPGHQQAARSPRCVDIGYGLRPPLYQVVVAILTGLAILVQGEYLVVAALWGTAAVVWMLQPRLIRLSADERGIRVRNLGQETFVWSDISKIELTRRSIWGSQRIEITLNDGRTVRPWATRTGDKSVHSYVEIDRVLRKLIMLRRDALGIPDPPGLAAALAAARRGDPAEIDKLLATDEIDSALYEERLHELAATGEIDLDSLRRARREQLGET
jgi:hypothetical protein